MSKITTQTTTITEKNRPEIIDYLKSRTKEDVVTLLSMLHNKPKGEVRKEVETLMEEEAISKVKPKTMASQLEEWFYSVDKPLELTKEDIYKQATAIGMTKGSLKYYSDQYYLAIQISKKLNTVKKLEELAKTNVKELKAKK